jgi:hypothetical protein
MLEPIAEVAPRVLAGLLGHALKEEAQDREPHMGVDAVSDPVEDWSEADAAPELPPALLDPQQLLVAQGRPIPSRRIHRPVY